MKANLLIMFWVESSRVAIEYPFLDMINMVGNIWTKKMSFTRKLLAKIKKIVVPFKVFFIECDHGHSVFKFTLHFSHGSELLLFKVLKVTQDLSILQKVVQASHYQDHIVRYGRNSPGKQRTTNADFTIIFSSIKRLCFGNLLILIMYWDRGIKSLQR